MVGCEIIAIVAHGHIGHLLVVAVYAGAQEVAGACARCIDLAAAAYAVVGIDQVTAKGDGEPLYFALVVPHLGGYAAHAIAGGAWRCAYHKRATAGQGVACHLLCKFLHLTVECRAREWGKVGHTLHCTAKMGGWSGRKKDRKWGFDPQGISDLRFRIWDFGLD